MSVNGVTSATSTYATTQTTAKTSTAAKSTSDTKTDNTGVVYEKSTNATDSKNKVKDYSSVVSSMKKELNTKHTASESGKPAVGQAGQQIYKTC